MPPIIGITQTTYIYHPQTLRDHLFRCAYFSAIRQVGGIPLELSSLRIGNQSSSTLDHIDGILFSGGGDINPHIYGIGSDKYVDGIDDQRDAFELALFNLALERDVPILGICRGCQLVNVALGGSLYTDLNQEHPSNYEHDWHPSRQYLAHSVILEPDCRLIEIGYSTNCKVNSLHHQGIKELGKGLMPFARARDGLIEGIELTGHRFGLAVQWHPEWLTDQQPTRALFECFIKACE